ncbi:serine aminopeptidase domain-containing protein [Psychroserpens mesophilus]|uniref:serine aminopeptidase domain-containing protein n=1 Tax=Psychroserpens mesophilus TaxID=325473 RepID=UPI003D65D097
MKTLKYITIALVLQFAHHISDAQTLKRKGLLGIMMQTMTDSIATQHNLKVNSGVHISTVMPNSTFSNLGVKQGDVLTTLNGKSVNTIQDVLAITSQLYEGDEIKVEYYSNNIIQSNSTVLKGRPIESFEKGNVTYGEVVYKDNVLRSILVTPKQHKKAPVVYFLQGYTCGSIETVSNDSPMKKLMNDWVNAGFAIYRIEKPGVGDSQSKKQCSEINFEEELTAFKEGYKDLRNQETVDANNIFLFGHSMGGVIAPLLNKFQAPRGIITYGTVAENWYDYMVDLYTIQPKHFGVSDAQIKEDSKVYLKFNDDFLIKKLSGEEMLKNEAYVEFFNASDFERNQYIGRHFKFWQNLADVNIPKVWSQVKTNVLALHGEFDIQAIDKKGAEKLVDIVNKNGGKGDFILIKNADHGFVNFKSMQHNVETLSDGSYMTHARDNYSIMIGKESTRWILSKIK